MGWPPDPDWYLDHVLYYAEPGRGDAVRPGPAALWLAWWRGLAATDAVMTGAARHAFVFGTDDLRAAGMSRARVRTVVANRTWTAVGRGTVSPVRCDDGDVGRWVAARRRHALIAAAAVRGRPDLVVSGRSAAILHGLPTLDIPARPEITRIGDARLGRRSGAHVHGATLAARHVGSWFGIPVTRVGRTVVDVARHDRRDGIMAADAALRENLVTPEQLARQLVGAQGWPGVRKAREILALADPLAESPLESMVRLAMHDAGLPPPELQRTVGAFRVDLCWPGSKLIVEVDGLEKYTGAALRREKRREQRLRALGYRVERITWDDLSGYWPETLAVLRDALGV